jgi:hypothetical protein
MHPVSLFADTRLRLPLAERSGSFSCKTAYVIHVRLQAMLGQVSAIGVPQPLWLWLTGVGAAWLPRLAGVGGGAFSMLAEHLHHIFA